MSKSQYKEYPVRQLTMYVHGALALCANTAKEDEIPRILQKIGNFALVHILGRYVTASLSFTWSQYNIFSYIYNIHQLASTPKSTHSSYLFSSKDLGFRILVFIYFSKDCNSGIYSCWSSSSDSRALHIISFLGKRENTNNSVKDLQNDLRFCFVVWDNRKNSRFHFGKLWKQEIQIIGVKDQQH